MTVNCETEKRSAVRCRAKHAVFQMGFFFYFLNETAAFAFRLIMHTRTLVFIIFPLKHRSNQYR